MKVIDKTPLQNEKGEIGTLQRLQGTLEHGFSWYPELEAQKAIITQLDRVLEKGFTLIRNLTLPNSQIVEPIILIGPPGIYVIQVINVGGFYEAKGEQWNTVNNGRSVPAPINLMFRVARLARALQVYLDRQGVILPGPVEPVLMASNPALHVDSVRPMVRVVMSDAIKQFAGSLLQARPVLKSEFAYDLADRIITPRPKGAAPVTAQEQPPAEAPQAEAPAPGRARAIFHAAEEAKPFDPADLSFAFDENAENAIPENLLEPSPSQRLPRPGQGRRISPRQLLLLGGMLVFECCILAGFGYLIFLGAR